MKQEIDQQKPQTLEQPDYDRILENQDFFPKIFLIPAEIRLHKDEGLKIVKRSRNSPDKFEEERVLPITVDEELIRGFNKTNRSTISDADNKRHPAGHGLLSLFKKTPERRIKLAICICVYSEPKHMLKNTIKGIQESYKHFREKAGILPHEIILIVIFDGIQKINASADQTENMISFFNEIDIKNGFVYKPYGRSLEQYLSELEARSFDIAQMGPQSSEDISLFTEEELSALKTKLFENQYSEYMRIKALKVQIQKLKKEKNIRVESLPHEINKKYEELCLNYCMENNMYHENQEEMEEYLSIKKNIRVKLIYDAINSTELLCKKYMESRQDKAILYPVRLDSSDLENPRNNHNETTDHELSHSVAKQYNYMFFVVKHKNEGKLSSHMLFFQGFCKLFDPEYCMLTDVGIKPHKDAIYRMWAHMEQRPKCGGVCGYMGLKLENPYDDLGYREDGFDADSLDCLTRTAELFFTVQRAQQFEYHFAHMLDKPFQAAFGYIHVLPGAFSGYRWKALKSVEYKGRESQALTYNQIQTDCNMSMISTNSDQNQETIMKRYLKIATADQSEICLQDSNMYLAQDRIMCLGIHALGYDLDYLPDVQSTVDPVTSLTRLLGQRRRWINGSWFAFSYVREHSYERTSCLFLVQLYYYIIVYKLTWIGPALFYIALNLTLIAAVRDYVMLLFCHFFNVKTTIELYGFNVLIFNVGSMVTSIPDIINFIYIMITFSVALYSLLLNHNNHKFKQIYYYAASLLGLYGMAVFALLIYNSYRIVSSSFTREDEGSFVIPLAYLRILIIIILLGHALPILWTFSIKKYIEMVTSLLSYLFYAPTYVNILQIFAFCRIDDLSWGTKGLDTDSTVSSVAKQWQRRKYIFVLQYITSNVIISYIFIKLSEYDTPRNCIILGSVCLVAFLLLFRLVPAGLYLLRYQLRRMCHRTFSKEYHQNNLTNGMRILNALKVIELKIKEIEKAEVKKKKEAEYKNFATATSEIFSRGLSRVGAKIRSKVAQHMINNNVIPKRELLQQKRKPKRKVQLRRNLKTVEQASNEESEQSKTTTLPHNHPKTTEYTNKPVQAVPNNKKTDIRARLQKMKQKKSKEIEQKSDNP